MSVRDPLFREDVLMLDGYRCVLCSFNGEEEHNKSRLHADHVEPRGMGGSPSKDDRANGMTLCWKCHDLKTKEIIKIVAWDRDNEAFGLGVLELNETNTYEERPQDTLWFYRKHDKGLLEESLEALRVMAASDAQRARVLGFVWNNFDLAEGAKSPEQLVSSLGLDPNQSKREAYAYNKLDKLFLPWPDGVNFSKITLIIKSIGDRDHLSPDERDHYREILISAIHSSYSDLEGTLFPKDTDEPKQTGAIRKNLYYVVERPGFLSKGRFVFGEEGDVSPGEDRIVLRVDKLYPPLRRRKENLFITTDEVEEMVRGVFVHDDQ